ncbi:MAG TPA: DnaJ domain-containing protein, partial [Rubrobacter sp.]|nr:DnaJ domain-containing protein [Rubrobacter sp.]
MEKLDLYKVLEVSKEASQDEIRRSYRRLARKYHPDANPGDRQAEERFKEIQQAYEVLSKPEKRREYDEGPRTYFGAGQPGGAAFEDFSDLLGGFGNLGDIFGRPSGAAGTASAKGENITVNVRLNFKDAL